MIANYPTISANPPRRVEILLFAEAQLLDVTGPAQVFASANKVFASANKVFASANKVSARPLYEIALVAEAEQTRCDSGVTLLCQPLADGAPPDSLIVAGGSGVNAACARPALVSWLRRRAGAARRLASVCSGAFLLAEAGLLEDRRAVTHWRRCDEFAARFPKVRLERDPIFLCDGGIWTSAGVTAGIDLALALVEQDQGRALALAVARELVVFLKRPGGQAQFSAPLEAQGADERFADLHAWIAENLRSRLTLEVLAARAGMSLRSFARHYRARIGHTPAEMVEKIRLERARERLEAGASIEATARACGFGAPETLRRVFQRRLGVAPSEWRDRFCGGGR